MSHVQNNHLVGDHCIDCLYFFDHDGMHWLYHWFWRTQASVAEQHDADQPLPPHCWYVAGH